MNICLPYSVLPLDYLLEERDHLMKKSAYEVSLNSSTAKHKGSSPVAAAKINTIYRRVNFTELIAK
jgi:hypothetical protein